MVKRTTVVAAIGTFAVAWLAPGLASAQ